MNNITQQTKPGAYAGKILFYSIYLLDIFFIYSAVRGYIPYFAAGAGALIGAVYLAAPVTRLALGAYSAEGARPYDREYLNGCLDSVRACFETMGLPQKNISLYVCRGGSEVRALGNSIVIPEAMLDRGKRSFLEAAMAHCLAHIYNGDSLLKALLIINTAAIVCMAAFTLLGMFIGVVIVVVILASIFWKGASGMIAGAYTAKGMKALFKGMMKLYTGAMKLIYTGLCRASEYAADDLAADMGYGQQLIAYLRFEEQYGAAAGQTPFEALLDSHPPAYRRVARLENRLQINSGGNYPNGNNYSNLF